MGGRGSKLEGEGEDLAGLRFGVLGFGLPEGVARLDLRKDLEPAELEGEVEGGEVGDREGKGEGEVSKLVFVGLGFDFVGGGVVRSDLR